MKIDHYHFSCLNHLGNVILYSVRDNTNPPPYSSYSLNWLSVGGHINIIQMDCIDNTVVQGSQIFISIFIYLHLYLHLQQQANVHETLMKMQQEIDKMEAKLATTTTDNHDDEDNSDVESDTEMESRLPDDDGDDNQDDVFHDADDEIAPNDDDDDKFVEFSDADGDETLDPREEVDEHDVEGDMRQQHVRSPSHDNTVEQEVDDGARRRSQRLAFSDEEEDERTNVKSKKDVDSVHRHNNSEDDDDPLPQCPRSPSPPPPLTQGKMQKYKSGRSPLQDTLKSVTKLAEQFKSGTSSATSNSLKKSDKAVTSRQRTESDSSDEDEVGSVSRKSVKRPEVTETLQYKALSSDSDSLDDDISRRGSSQRKRNYKRRLRSDSDSSDEEETTPRNVKKHARLKSVTPRSRGGSTPMAKGKAGMRDFVKPTQRTRRDSQDNVKTQRTLENSRSLARNNSQILKKNTNQSQRTPSPAVVESSLPKDASSKSRTPNAATAGHSAGRIEAVKRDRSPLAATGGTDSKVNQGSPLMMESSCRRTLQQEESAPVVAKNLRKNDGKFSFVATGLSRQELVS